MALSHRLWWLMRLADTVNLCVRMMGASSFWQTAAQHTFLSKFRSTLHLPWPPSETLWKLLKLVNFYSLFTAWSPLASTGLYTHVPYINRTFFVFSIPHPPSFFYLFSVLSASTPLTSSPPPFIILHTPSQIPFLCGTTPFSLKQDDSFTPYQTCLWKWHCTGQQLRGEERKGDVGGERELPFNSWSRPPALFETWTSLAILCFPQPIFLSTVLIHQGKLWEKKDTMCKEGYWGFEVLDWRNKSFQWKGFSVKAD